MEFTESEFLFETEVPYDEVIVLLLMLMMSLQKSVDMRSMS